VYIFLGLCKVGLKGGKNLVAGKLIFLLELGPEFSLNTKSLKKILFSLFGE